MSARRFTDADLEFLRLAGGMAGEILDARRQPVRDLGPLVAEVAVACGADPEAFSASALSRSLARSKGDVLAALRLLNDARETVLGRETGTAEGAS